MKPVFEPRFGECRQCEHFRKKEACRYHEDCAAGEWFEERMDDCVPTDETLTQRMMKRERHD